jgi:hypothetical protein
MKLTADGGPDDWRRTFRRPTITVDGVQVERVTEVDTEAGYVDHAATDDKGRVRHDGKRVTIERLHGHVEVFEAG